MAFGHASVGFDRNSDGIALAPFIGRTLSVAEMDSADATPQYSAYVRYSFDVADKDQLTSLQLDLRFDDGFIAYLNGREVRRVNFAEDFVYYAAAMELVRWKPGHQLDFRGRKPYR